LWGETKTGEKKRGSRVKKTPWSPNRPGGPPKPKNPPNYPHRGGGGVAKKKWLGGHPSPFGGSHWKNKPPRAPPPQGEGTTQKRKKIKKKTKRKNFVKPAHQKKNKEKKTTPPVKKGERRRKGEKRGGSLAPAKTPIPKNHGELEDPLDRYKVPKTFGTQRRSCLNTQRLHTPCQRR